MKRKIYQELLEWKRHDARKVALRIPVYMLPFELEYAPATARAALR